MPAKDPYERVPWVQPILRRHSERVRRLIELAHLSNVGISLLVRRTELVEALVDYDKVSAREPSYKEKEIDDVRAEAALAQREVKEGFPLLWGRTVVASWSMLESYIRGMLAGWLRNQPDALQTEGVQRLRVRIGEYESIPPEERAEFIIELLDRDLVAPLRLGVNRFEPLLKVFSLDGAVEDDVSRKIFQLHQVRNLIAHKDGVCDRRFIERCPELGLAIGDQFHVSRPMAYSLVTATIKYAHTVLLRFLSAAGGPDLSQTQ